MTLRVMTASAILLCLLLDCLTVSLESTHQLTELCYQKRENPGAASSSAERNVRYVLHPPVVVPVLAKRPGRRRTTRITSYVAYTTIEAGRCAICLLYPLANTYGIAKYSLLRRL
jgi:hypothetical protein